ncbi:MAG: hypothetical protein IT429_14215 [Gemmataceae bacterium]|nr:hypothetical protein [Gemmataceae bacterium]
MTLANTVLARLSEWRPPQGRQTLAVTDPASGWTAALTADRADVVGCLVWEIALRRDAASADGPQDLRAWAEGAAARVTGLLEPLAVHEVDSGRNEALLRSTGPSRRSDQLFYYEVLLRGTTAAVVRRYQASPQSIERRQQVAFALTHEALAQFVANLAGVK